MSEKWLTGSEIENISSYFDPVNESADVCEVANDLLDDRKRMVRLLEEAQGELDTDCVSGEEIHKKIRACFKAQGE